MTKVFAPTDPAVSRMEEEHKALVRALAPQGMVLLENDGTLPLAGPEKLALYGRGARHTVRGGTGSGDVNARENVTVEQGLLNAGFTVETGAWLDKLDRELEAAQAAHEAELQEAMKDKSRSPIIIYFEHPFQAPPEPVIPETGTGDLAIYVLSRNSGEGKDRDAAPGDYFLSEREEENLRTLRKNYKRLVVLLNVGGVIDTAFLKALKPNALLHMSQAGAGGGDALADALLGVTPPSGRLTDTWALDYRDYPSSATFGKQDGNVDREPYGEDIYVGYRYFDTFGKDVAYPFGYGLDYTDFALTAAGAAVTPTVLTLKAKAENTGARPGRFVVQYYVTPPQGKLPKARQMLIAYGKTKLLQPGESQELTLRCSLRDLSSFCEENSCWVLEPGDYIIRLGRHSRDSHVAAVLRLDDVAYLETVGRYMAMEEEIDLLRPEGVTPLRFPGEEAEKAAAPVLELKAAEIPCVLRAPVKPMLPAAPAEPVTLEDVALGRRSALEWAAQQSDEALTGLVVGAGGNQSTVGSASVHVPGAAGETGSHIPGVPPMILADGPAGLRLTPHFQVLKSGKVRQLGNHFAALMGDNGEDDDLTGAVDYYQYATAIPIATLLAQSWDVELVKACGRLVGKEMEKFGVTLWLAPGMNIHRNPLCGRNFEYYSEDPLVAGLTAAAMTLGVQETPGVGVTPKHFATNNQEDNRAYENNAVSVRALREIYLRGFELCVRLAQPMSVMTSYNCINGTHAANHAGLLNGALRGDWGFRGFVMTDWGTTGHSGMEMAEGVDSVPSLCIEAGNDLIMPGNPNDIQDILDALAGKTAHPLRREELVRCAGRIFAVLAGSNLGPKPVQWSGRVR